MTPHEGTPKSYPLIEHLDPEYLPRAQNEAVINIVNDFKIALFKEEFEGHSYPEGVKKYEAAIDYGQVGKPELKGWDAVKIEITEDPTKSKTQLRIMHSLFERTEFGPLTSYTNNIYLHISGNADDTTIDRDNIWLLEQAEMRGGLANARHMFDLVPSSPLGSDGIGSDKITDGPNDLPYTEHYLTERGIEELRALLDFCEKPGILRKVSRFHPSEYQGSMTSIRMLYQTDPAYRRFAANFTKTPEYLADARLAANGYAEAVNMIHEDMTGKKRHPEIGTPALREKALARATQRITGLMRGMFREK